ncbi:unnamed protein product [Acanthoscelides obtectus]|uniref:PiggyBac transposable element-derived protein 4 C-terminal zinc-ribbon domain-containing protein n=1 Tax=Acanthoscelides obtectus TaxID=200917 RepID=A0A9P0PE49_ACAOB|nr:unnamed protein product [Acanthoscelides obtectus]CAK1674741.1 hypothetical protein AOBTE_LOCUS29723 [Acanthoscelides obtectus]
MTYVLGKMDLSRINKMKINDPRFEQWAQSILEAEESDFSGNDDSHNDPDYVSEHESDSEIEWAPETVALETTLDVSDTTSQNAAPSNEHQEIPNSTPRTYYGKNRYKWTADAPLSNKDVPEPSNDVLTKRVRCSKCPRSLDRKTKIVCASCKAPICHGTLNLYV